MSLLDSIEALVHHKKHVEQLATVLSQPQAPILTSSSKGATTVATVSLPQLSLLSNIPTVLSGLIQVTGLQSAITAFEQVQTIIKNGDYTPATIDGLLTDLKTMLSSVGTYVPGGAFSQIENEIAKYEELASKIEAGQSVEVADVQYVSKSGQRFDCVLSLSVKAHQSI